MAQSKPFHVSCTCYHPVFKYLGETQFTDEVLQKLSGLIKKKAEAPLPVSVMYISACGTIRPLIRGVVDKVNAIGFHGGKVVATGSAAEVTTQMKQLGIKYITIKLSAGQTLLPGFIDPHVHIILKGLMMGWNDFGPFDGQNLREGYNLKWLEQQIQSAKETIPAGSDAWILGRTVDASLMPFIPGEQGGLAKLERFNCENVDKLEKDVPLLMLSASMHTAHVNTRALKLIYDSTPEIQEKYKTFEAYWDHVNSRGGLQEIEEIIPALGVIPKRQLLEMLLGVKKHLDAWFETANKRGVTMMYDAAMSPQLKVILHIYLSGEASPRVRIGYALICETLEGAEGLPPYEPLTEFKNVYQGNVKLVSDGSNPGLTGYLSEPYNCEPPNNIGYFNFPYQSTPDQVTPLFKQIVKTIAG